MVLPKLASDFVMLYAAFSVIALLLFLRRKPKRGMRLRLKGGESSTNETASPLPPQNQPTVHQPPAPQHPAPERFSHVSPQGERPLNVMFNYNGHSWDAYEVLGLPAGSSLESVDHAYAQALKSVEHPSRPFLDAAYHAILAQWSAYKKVGRA